MILATATATATTTTTMLLPNNNSSSNDTAVILALRRIFDLGNAKQELRQAERKVRDNALSISAARRALQQAQMRKGILEYSALRKRKAVEEADAHLSDALKLVHQTSFKKAARGAGLFASCYSASSTSSNNEDESGEEGLGYEPSSPPFSITPPDSPTTTLYVPTSPPYSSSCWGEEKEDGEVSSSSSSSSSEEDN
jgi:hypothetical protein